MRSHSCGERAHLAHLLDEADARVDEERDAADDLGELVVGRPGPTRAPRRARAIAVASPYASSCTGVAPASCRWYGHTLIGFHVGTCLHRVADQVDGQALRRLGREDVGAARQVLLHDVVLRRARELLAGRRPARSASAMYMPSSHIAVALIVIDVFISSSGMPSNSVRISPRCGTGTPTLPTSPRASDVVGVVAGLGREVEGDRQTGLALARGWSRYSSFDARADEWPEYVRISQGRSRPVTCHLHVVAGTSRTRALAHFSRRVGPTLSSRIPSSAGR